ncbi:MAG: hypothetical protein DRP22_00405 [Verrucomicrobia bacterium]|nr:MAG: hypothetical protein DRP22_00405 [Verrucomicrobiota bacterium]
MKSDPRYAASKVALTAVAAYALLLAGRLQRADWNPGVLVVAGDRFTDRSQAARFLPVLSNSPGYDGAFYFRLAVSPWNWTGRVAGIVLDAPAYRARRILYPFLAWMLARGDPFRSAVALLLINWLGLGVIAWLGARWAVGERLSAWWGLLFVFYAGYLMSLFRDLTEIVAGMCLMGALVAWREHSAVKQSGLLALGCLARETVVLAAGAAAIDTLIRRGGGMKRYFMALLPFVVFGAWQLVIVMHLPGNGSDTRLAALNFSAPFKGIGHLVSTILTQPRPVHLLWMLELSVLALSAVVVAYRQIKRQVPAVWIVAAWAVYALMIIMLSERVWCEDWAFARVAYEYHLLSCVIMLRRPLKPVFRLVGAWYVVVWMATAAHVVLRP